MGKLEKNSHSDWSPFRHMITNLKWVLSMTAFQLSFHSLPLYFSSGEVFHIILLSLLKTLIPPPLSSLVKAEDFVSPITDITEAIRRELAYLPSAKSISLSAYVAVFAAFLPWELCPSKATFLYAGSHLLNYSEVSSCACPPLPHIISFSFYCIIATNTEAYWNISHFYCPIW